MKKKNFFALKIYLILFISEGPCAATLTLKNTGLDVKHTQ